MDSPLAAAPELDAYALLSRPTLDLTDAQVTLIVADLRARRERMLSTGKPDKPKAEAKVKAPRAEPMTPAEKAAAKKRATADLLASLELKL